MKKIIITALSIVTLSMMESHAVTYAIDINTEETNGSGVFSATAAGWSALNVNRTDGLGSATIGGINFSTGSTDGARVRGTVAVPNPNDLTGDFAFDDGAGQAIILFIGGAGDLAAGDWQVEVWSWDESSTFGDQIIGYRTNGTETVATSTATADPNNPVVTFTFTSDGTSAYDIFVRENNSENRSRLNAVRITSVPEPSSTALLGLGGLALMLRRRR